MKIKIILSIIVLIFLIKLDSATAENITVCTTGCNYTSIQGAVYNASRGDVINVLNGSYSENITVNVSVTLNATPYILLTSGFNISASNVTKEEVIENITEVKEETPAVEAKEEKSWVWLAVVGLVMIIGLVGYLYLGKKKIKKQIPKD